MIEVTLSNIVNSIAAMQNLSKRNLKGRAAFRAAKLMKEIDNEYQLFNNSRKQLIEKYGVKDENNQLKVDENGNYNISSDCIQNFNQELEDLLNSKVELNCFPIDLADLENDIFTPEDMAALDVFIKE